MTRSTLTILLSTLLCTCSLIAQFTPDYFGHVNSPAFLALTKKRGYELVGSFTPEHRNDVTILYASVWKNGKELYIDTTGREFPDGETLFAHYFRDEPVEVSRERPVSSEASENLHYLPGDYEIVSTGSQKGVLLNGKTIVSPAFENVLPWYWRGRLFFEVSNRFKHGVLDSTGKILLPAVYQSVRLIRAGNAVLIAAFDGEFTFVFDSNGRKLVECLPYRLEEDRRYSEPYIKVENAETKKCGLMDTLGNLVLKPQYNVVEEIGYNGVFLVTVWEGYGKQFKGLVASGDDILINSEYRYISPLTDSTVIVRKLAADDDEPAGIYNVFTRSWLLPVEYMMRPNAHSPYTVRSVLGDHLTGITDGKEIIVPIVYNTISFARGGSEIIVDREGKFGALTLAGDTLVPLIYEYLDKANDCLKCYRIPADWYIAEESGKFGVVSQAGKTIVPFIYPKLEVTTSAFVYADKQNVTLIGADGKELFTSDFYVGHIYRGIVEGKAKESDATVRVDLYGNRLVIPPKPEN